ncbi:serine hydrolase domain-containing protein [Rhizorhapis suberifaciens]|uniref:CubicO group peptidase (Beta-lactamase class C family) n=1 Tax=Rhizorhapis suberifaciens TaxID=13656 RepID=A0A840HZL1_9SPHN|nr:serine hydrolase domain-containing protein [Rhizorhapis suberifaciens]MBB4642846.1 CubicO group peptidase (beta-lactamase class C family) [Rhizorhapis suberifaciens]
MGSGFLSRRDMIVGTAGLPLAGVAMAAEAPKRVAGSPSLRSTIHGTVAPGYEPVRAAFEDNFASGKEIGAHFAVFRDGAPLVDLWGGSADEAGTVPVTENTLYTLMSTTKGLTSMCIAMLVDRGKLDYEAPVAKYWPEFAAEGKGAVTVGELMSHQAGLTGPRVPASVEDFYEHKALAARLAAQEPFFRPGVFGYHSMTFGTLADELVRRTDGRTVSRFFAEEVASPLKIDAFMGLPAKEEYRAATMVSAMDPNSLGFDSPNPAALAASAIRGSSLWGPDQAKGRAYGNPAGGGTSNARNLAKLYAHLVGRDQPGVTPLISKSVLQQATRARIAGLNQTHGELGRYAAGFRLDQTRYGSNPASFGHCGFGGSTAFADPARRLGVSYTPNRMLNPNWYGTDPRLAALLNALFTAEKTK